MTRWYATQDPAAAWFVRVRKASSATGSRPTAARGGAIRRGAASKPRRGATISTSAGLPLGRTETLIFRRLKGGAWSGRSACRWSTPSWARRAGRSGSSPGAIPDRFTAPPILHQVYTAADPRLHRPCHGPGRLGQEAWHDRQQRDRPRSSACSTAPSTRRDRRRNRSTSARKTCARRSKRSTSASITRINNGGLQVGLRDDPAGLRGSLRPVVRRPSTRVESSAGSSPLLGGRPDHGGRLAAVHDAGSLRSRLCRSFQVQPAADCRLSQSQQLHEGTLSDPRRGRDGRSEPT